MSPLLLVLDGVLSQDEERVTQALREITLAHVLPLAIVNNCSPSDLLATTTTTTTILESNASSSSSDALLNLLRALLDAAPSLAGIASSHDGSLPLHFAASLGDVRVASLLLDRVSSLSKGRWEC